MKKLKVMADFSSSGIWDGETGHMIDHEDLSLDGGLIDEFEKWIYYYSESYKSDYSTLKEGKAEKLNKWGRELAQKLKDKLGNGYEITYQGEDENGLLDLITV